MPYLNPGSSRRQSHGHGIPRLPVSVALMEPHFARRLPEAVPDSRLATVCDARRGMTGPLLCVCASLLEPYDQG
jgi:hypothetical protein